MLTSPRRLLSAALALALGVGFVAAALMLATSLDTSLRAAAGGATRDAKVVLTQDPDSAAPPTLPESYVATLRALPGVDRVRPVVSTYAGSVDDNSAQTFLVQTPPELSDRTQLLEGRLPGSDREAAVNRVAAELRGWRPGDTATFEVEDRQEYTIVGIVDAGADTTAYREMPHVFLTMEGIQRLSGRTSYTDLYVHGTLPEAELRNAVLAVPETAGTGAAVLTASEASDQRVREFTRGSEQLAAMLLAFGAVAVIVAGLVVANTFAILVAQRTRQLALLRTVGATQGQVFRTVLAEAAVLGLVSALVGLGLGAAAVAGIAPLSQGNPVLAIDGLAIAPRDIVLPLVVGVALAVGAALIPARQATRVPPLAAMRPQVATAVDPRVRQGRPVVALVVTLSGFVILVAGAVALPLANVAASLSVLVGIAGGLLSVAGVLALGRRIVPVLARLLGAGLRRAGGLPAELAADNAVRNPGRAAATTGALLVGVTLVTMMTVGAATGQASIEADLARHYPMDVEVTSWELLSDAQVELAATLPDVAASTVLLSSSATTEDGQWVPLRGMEPDSAGVLRAPIDLGQLTDGVLLVGPEMKLPDGVPITLTGAERQVTLTVAVNPRADGLNAVTPATMAQLDPHPMRSLGVRLVDGVDPVGAVARVGAALGEVGPGVDVNSVAERRVQVQQMIDTVLLVVLGLLAVAVVIAVVGIGNTLALSVHERRQESGLLRAMGLTRGQLRASLGWEAVLLAAVAVVLGLVLGIVYGFAGVSALVSADAELLLRVPWERLALIVVVALLAGWLASVLPSIRAAKVPPAAALALGE